MEILSPGEKLKKIRKQFKIRQHEITGGEITREFISIVENNKSKLTPQVANILVENINKLCMERNIDFNLTSSYLLEDIKSQTNRVADKYIDFLCNNNEINLDFQRYVKEMELFLMQYDIGERKSIIYEKIGDIYKDANEYNTSYRYYIASFESHSTSLKDIRLFKILQKLSSVCIWLNKFKEALDFNSLALIYNGDVPKKFVYKLHFNNVLSYIYLNQHSKALNEIKTIENSFNNLCKQDLFELNSLKANSLRHQKFYSEALKLNEHILTSLKDSDLENRIFILNNILDLYTLLKDVGNTKKYLTEIIDTIHRFDDIDSSYHAPNIYNQIGQSLILIENVALAKIYYEKSINACRIHKNIYVLEKSLNLYLDILIKESSLEEINTFKNQILEFISLDIMSKNDHIILKLISFYNEKRDRDSIKGLLDFVLS